MELARPVRFTDQVHTICLMKEKLLTKTEATVAGWGLTQAFGPSCFKSKIKFDVMNLNVSFLNRYKLISTNVVVHLIADGQSERMSPILQGNRKDDL